MRKRDEGETCEHVCVKKTESERERETQRRGMGERKRVRDTDDHKNNLWSGQN